MLYLCVGTNSYELYTPNLYTIEKKIDDLSAQIGSIDDLLAIQLQTIIGNENIE